MVILLRSQRSRETGEGPEYLQSPKDVFFLPCFPLCEYYWHFGHKSEVKSQGPKDVEDQRNIHLNIVSTGPRLKPKQNLMAWNLDVLKQNLMAWNLVEGGSAGYFNSICQFKICLRWWTELENLQLEKLIVKHVKS